MLMYGRIQQADIREFRVDHNPELIFIQFDGINSVVHNNARAICTVPYNRTILALCMDLREGMYKLSRFIEYMEIKVYRPERFIGDLKNILYAISVWRDIILRLFEVGHISGACPQDRGGIIFPVPG